MSVSVQNKERIKKIKEIVRVIDGWLSESEGEYLYAIAKSGPGEGAIIEIGSWKGKATVWLASGAKDAGRDKVYAIDHYRGSPEHGEKVWTFPEFEKNLRDAGVDDMVVPLVMNSAEAAKNWDKPVRFLWIDAAHDYESVKRDFLLWEPSLVEGGIVAFHDTTTWDGPKKVVEEYVCNSRTFTNIGSVGSIVFAQKTRKSSAWDMLKAKLVLGARDASLKSNLPRGIKVFGRNILIFLGLHPKIERR